MFRVTKSSVLVTICHSELVSESCVVKILKQVQGDNNSLHVPKELFSMDNVVLLPHIGSATTETRIKMGQLVIDNILAHFDGKELLTEVKL